MQIFNNQSKILEFFLIRILSTRRMQLLFGFSLSEVSSWDSVVTLLSRPTDPASLAVIRILFGILMMLDIPQERGLGQLEERWGSPSACHFPLFDFIHPLSLKWMYIIYIVMFLGALGMTLGLFYRVSNFCFVATYWYCHLLDTTTWNNHSYLFGLLGTLLLFTDAHHCWSLDGLRSERFRDKHVPLWNYTVLRTQIFLVYFIAGLKKADPDWIGGYSMRHLSSHWVFAPFRLLLNEATIDYYVVHLFGFVFDLTIGFFLFFDVTRPVAFVFCAAFNLMNSQLFCIGMFPYTMLVTMSLFCHTNWPRQLLRFVCHASKLQMSEHCLYATTSTSPRNTIESKTQCRMYHRLAAVLTILHVCLQLFLPYSHFITVGYNHWSNGLYGYSWDMMVHSWHTQHVRVTIHDKKTGVVRYVNPKKWVRNNRWTRYARLAKQYARCVQRNLGRYGLDDIEIYLDVWGSLNQRFEQRFFRPDVDILSADWSPFGTPDWTLPIVQELTPWRDTLIAWTNASTSPDGLTFLADFPGLSVDTPGTSTEKIASIQVLQGELLVETLGKANVSLHTNDTMTLPVDLPVRIHVTSPSPACYLHTDESSVSSPVSRKQQGLSFWQRKYNTFAHSFWMSSRALRSVVIGTTLDIY